VAEIGGTYHHGAVADVGFRPDVAIECTGVAAVISDVMEAAGNNGIICLTGVSSAKELQVDIGTLNRQMVLANNAIFGSVNANRRHYEAGAAALAQADQAWLAKLITRSVHIDNWKDAYTRQPTDVKVVLEFAS
jgi:threonine dehydrogenase-like Zn-dependent dehydrogenase